MHACVGVTTQIVDVPSLRWSPMLPVCATVFPLAHKTGRDPVQRFLFAVPVPARVDHGRRRDPGELVAISEPLKQKGLEWLEECWQTKRKEAARTPKTLTMWEMNMFGVPWDVSGTLLPEEVMERYMSWQLKVNVVKQVFSSADQIDTEIGDADVFARCRELNSIMYHTMLHVAHFCSVAQPEPYMTPWDGEAETLDQVMRFHKSTEKMKSVQLALFRILGSHRPSTGIT